MLRVRPTRLLLWRAAGPDDRSAIVPRIVGVVDRSEPGPLAGKRVAAPVRITCGRCSACKSGLAEQCLKPRESDVFDEDGQWRTELAIPASSLVPVPDALDDDAATFAWDVGRVLHAAARLHLEGKPFVTVLGDNALALLAVQVMASRNASVRCLGRRPRFFTLCEKWGIKHRHVDEVGRRQDQDIVVECSGEPTSLATATQLAKPRGKIALVRPWNGDEPQGPASVVERIIRRELTVVGVSGSSLAEGIGALAAGGVETASLVSRRFRRGDVAPALRAALDDEQLAVLADLG